MLRKEQIFARLTVCKRDVHAYVSESKKVGREESRTGVRVKKSLTGGILS